MKISLSQQNEYEMNFLSRVHNQKKNLQIRLKHNKEATYAAQFRCQKKLKAIDCSIRSPRNMNNLLVSNFDSKQPGKWEIDSALTQATSRKSIDDILDEALEQSNTFLDKPKVIVESPSSRVRNSLAGTESLKVPCTKPVMFLRNMKSTSRSMKRISIIKEANTDSTTKADAFGSVRNLNSFLSSYKRTKSNIRDACDPLTQIANMCAEFTDRKVREQSKNTLKPVILPKIGSCRNMTNLAESVSALKTQTSKKRFSKAEKIAEVFLSIPKESTFAARWSVA